MLRGVFQSLKKFIYRFSEIKFVLSLSFCHDEELCTKPCDQILYTDQLSIACLFPSLAKRNVLFQSGLLYAVP